MAESYQEVQRLHKRLHEIVASTCSLQEKRFRSMDIIEFVLEAVTPLLPTEYQRLVKEVLALHEHLW